PFFRRENVAMLSPPADFFALWQPRHFFTRIGATCSRKLTGFAGSSAPREARIPTRAIATGTLRTPGRVPSPPLTPPAQGGENDWNPRAFFPPLAKGGLGRVWLEPTTIGQPALCEPPRRGEFRSSLRSLTPHPNPPPQGGRGPETSRRVSTNSSSL